MINFGKPPPQSGGNFEPIPAGEVIEGNEESDWAAWEDSVAFQDSLMPGLQGSVTVSQSASVPTEPSAAPAKRSGPVVEVIEGNDDSHWAIWEDSVLFQESQMQAFQTMATAPEMSAADASTEHVDIFSSVNHKSA
jgi:hypothetical protein